MNPKRREVYHRSILSLTTLSRALLRLLLGRRLPVTTGTLEVPALTGRIVVRRDRWGIPHIEAGGELDAWYGLGFCQGQDRAFQIEILLRAVRGTLAELVGAGGLATDRLARRIGFHRSAQLQVEALAPEHRANLEAFVRGVHDGATLGCRGRRPHELVILGGLGGLRGRPTLFTAADILGILKLFCFTLPSNWDAELARLAILRQAGPHALLDLDPCVRGIETPDGPPCPAAERLRRDLEAFLGVVGGGGGGSNNWAVSPARTATGRPLLASDPHLGPFLPPAWYLAHVATPDWAVAGAAFPGAPVFPVGHNGAVAWGVTAGMTDNTDLFLEEIGPDGQSVREGDGHFHPCRVRREVFHARRGATVEEEVLETPRGPVIGPALTGETGAVSLCATWLSAKPIRGFLGAHRARTCGELRALFADWPALPLNLVCADVTGGIAWQLVGEAPRRRKGSGTLPMPGWDPEAGWHPDPVPFTEMPHAVDPAAGFVASANNPPPDGSPFLGVDWLEGYRHSRIVEALAGRHDWDLDAARALQTDLLSLPWRDLRDLLLAAPADDPDTRLALALLREWDGRVEAGSAAASVFELFVAGMSRRVAEARAPEAARRALGEGFTPLAPVTLFCVRRVGHLIDLLRRQPEGWLARPWPEEIAAELASAVRTLRARHGGSTGDWAWGRVRPLTLVHLLGQQPPLDRIFNLKPFPWGGDAHTVGQSAVDPLNPTGNPLFIASLRMVVDVGRWEESRFSLPGGQSGNPLSPHYADLLPFWQRGEGVPIAWSPEEVERAATRVLVLQPRISAGPPHTPPDSAPPPHPR